MSPSLLMPIRSAHPAELGEELETGALRGKGTNGPSRQEFRHSWASCATHPQGPPRVHQPGQARGHPSTASLCETPALQGFLYRLCPPGSAVRTAERDS